MIRVPRLLLVLGLVLVPVAGLSLAQQPYGASPGKATIVVRVPEGAKVKIGDFASMQTGRERVYYAPDLAPGWKYSYSVETTWTEKGQEKKETRTVEFRPGVVAMVDFTRPEPVTKPKKEEPKKEEPKKEEKKQEPPKKEEPKKVEPKKEEPKKEEPEKGKPKIDSTDAKVRSFEFSYGGLIKDLKPGQEASVWLPIPQTTSEQEIKILSDKLPEKGAFGHEKQYGNKMIHFQAKANDKGEIPFEITYAVKRKEVKTDHNANVTLQPRPKEPIDRFLQPDKLVPITGKPLDLIKEKKLPKEQFAAAKELYDVVDGHMKYSKEGTGWGRGDAVWACDSKFGNCTDFHSLFISMARGNKIPSKFEMGFPIPPKHGEGTIGGYHCWAWFLPESKGWIPVDISEANRFPNMKEYYFGNLTEDRVQFTTGRDIDLVPRQKGTSLNYFIYPYVEVDGQPYPADKVARTFRYKDVAAGN